jgi:malate dehydrogenase (oxaloacetate-decarboxylating)
METYKRPFAHPPERAVGFCEEGRGPDLLETIRGTKATVLLGLSGRPGAFNAEVVEAMCENTSHPIIFPLSNPTSSSEATPDDVLAWSGGMAMVATGSPFDPVVLDGEPHVIGQGNNAFIFPGLGFGALLAEVHHITHEMVLEAAFALADYVAERYLPDGLIYPPITDLKGASIRVAVRVMEQAVEDGVGTIPSFDEPDLESYVRRQFWRPEYLPVRFEP